MRNILKLIAVIFLGPLIMISFLLFTDANRYGQWAIQYDTNSPEPSWIRFYWVSESIGDSIYDKAAMMVPAKISGLPHPVSFQFDLGSDITMVYERNINSLAGTYKEFGRHIDRLKPPILFWNKQIAFKNLQLDFGNTKVFTNNCYIKKNYGQYLSSKDLKDSIPPQIGTIGADMFRDMVLIIDYPNQRFAICDSVPRSFNTSFTPIKLDTSGRAILPLIIHGHTYRALFDNGSSIFPLIVPKSRIDKFSGMNSTDTISVSSWGKMHNFIGRPLNESFTLGSQTFSNITIYSDSRKDAASRDYDAIAGNALFWDKTIIIDFRNRRFGVIDRLNRD